MKEKSSPSSNNYYNGQYVNNPNQNNRQQNPTQQQNNAYYNFYDRYNSRPITFNPPPHPPRTNAAHQNERFSPQKISHKMKMEIGDFAVAAKVEREDGTKECSIVKVERENVNGGNKIVCFNLFF